MRYAPDKQNLSRRPQGASHSGDATVDKPGRRWQLGIRRSRKKSEGIRPERGRA